MRANQSSIVLSLALLLVLPLAVVFEQKEPMIWQERLILPEFTTEPSRHTPLYPSGRYLPPVISKNLTLTAADGPLLIAKKVTIPADVTVTVEAGTKLFAHEFGQLAVQGKLLVNGTSQRPVAFSTNELHPANQIWSGIVFMPGSHGQLIYTQVQHSSPAISCLAGSQVSITHSQISAGSLALFVTSPTCSMTDSTIRGVRDGIIATNVSPLLAGTTIQSAHERLIIRPAHPVQ